MVTNDKKLPETEGSDRGLLDANNVWPKEDDEV